MTLVQSSVEPVKAYCSRCAREPRERRAVPIARSYPENLSVEHIEATFARHPWLWDSQIGAFARSLRDAAVSNA